MPKEKPPEPNYGPATPEEMQPAIEESGYLLEGRVTRLMGTRGFFVETNAFTPDPTEPGKAIETDVIGKCFEFVNEENKDTVTASVLVECKNNSQPFAFFMQRPQLPELNDVRIHYGGFPSFSLDQDTGVQVPIHKLLDMKAWHHYCNAQEVATQFCGFKWTNEQKPREKREWKAEPMEQYSKAFSRLAIVTASDSTDSAGPLPCIQMQMSYPVVVFQGLIYCVEDENGKAKITSADRLQLHHSATVAGRLILVQIDVVTEATFPQLMEDILAELKVLRDRIQGLYPKLLQSAIDQKMAASQRRARGVLGGITI